MKRLPILLALALAALAPRAARADGAASAADPVAPFDDYGAAMASDPANPTAAEWQTARAADLAARDAAWAEALLDGGRAAIDALLAEVKTGYATDPLVATEIAAVTQHAMAPAPRPWWKFWGSAEHPRRALWAARLQAFAEGSEAVDVKLFFIDQLRWCGYPRQAPALRAMAGARAVADFAALAADELEGRPAAGGKDKGK